MKRNIFLLIATMLTVVSCEQLERVDNPDFNVNVEKTVFNVGEDIKFSITGTADMVTFYSGEIGYDHDYINGRIAQPNYEISFESQCLDGTQTDQMHLLISKNFTGNYTIEGVQDSNVEWIDISDRFYWSPTGNVNRNYNSSGRSNISDLFDSAQDTAKFYVAFKQEVRDQTVYGTGNLNRVRYFSLRSNYNNATKEFYAHADMGWQLFSTPNKQTGRASLDNNIIMMRNNISSTESKTYYTEDWAVSKLISVPKTLDMGPDWGVSIKGFSDAYITNYTYSYKYPGVYKVVFKAINANIKKSKEVIKEILITVVE